MPKLSAMAFTSALLFACTNHGNPQQGSSKVNEIINLPVGVTLVENVVAKEGRLAIPFKKYTVIKFNCDLILFSS